jgi:hypothetical protein
MLPRTSWWESALLSCEREQCSTGFFSVSLKSEGHKFELVINLKTAKTLGASPETLTAPRLPICGATLCGVV